LRLTAIDFHSFWFDEAFTADLTRASYADIFLGAARDDGNPPLYPLIAKGWTALFGRSDASFRGLSTLLGVATVLPLVLLGRRFLGRAGGLWAGLLLAISPLAIELANEARAYALLQFLAAGTTWLFVRWVDHRRPAVYWAYVVGTVLLFYTHYYGPAVPLAHGLALLVDRRRRNLLLPWAGGMVLVAICFAPWLPAFAAQLRTPGNLIRSAGRWQMQFLSTPVVFSLGRTFAWRDSSFWLHIIGALATLTAFLLPVAIGLLGWRQRRFPLTLLATWMLLPILGPLAVALLFSPIYAARYASVGLPAFCLLLAHGLLRLSPVRRRLALSAILVFTGISLFRYNTEPLKDDWRSTVHSLQGRWQPGVPVFADPDWELISFWHYAEKGCLPANQTVTLQRLPPSPGRLAALVYQNGTEPLLADSVIHESDNFWLVLCVPSASAEQYSSALASRGYQVVENRIFHRVQLLRFSRPPKSNAEPSD
jgi:mannosyltransferase